MAYRHILNWGGLRGAVTLSLAMGVSTVQGAEQILPAVMLAVLFTIIVQGLSVGRLAHYLKLDVPSTDEKISRAESWISAKNSARQQMHELEQTSFAITGAPQAYKQLLEQEVAALKTQLVRWRIEEEGPSKELERYLARGLSLEISYAHQLFDQGLLEPSSYAHLRNHLNDQLNALEYGTAGPETSLFEKIPSTWRQFWGQQNRPNTVEQFICRDYLMAWMRRLCGRFAIARLSKLMELDSAELVVRAEVIKIYESWYQTAKAKIQSIEEQFPEIAKSQQQRIVQRISLTAQVNDIEQQGRTGLLKEADAQDMIEELSKLQYDNS